jgi:hypothetical protein
MLEKTQGQGIIKNAQSKDTGNIGQTRHRKKTNKTQEEDKQANNKDKAKHNATQTTKHMSNMDPIENKQLNI